MIKLLFGKKYIGFFFLLVHMIGEWFLIKCDFERPRKENTLYQYFVDNILGNLTLKPNQPYENLCDVINKVRKEI